MASETAEFKKGKDSHRLLLLLGLFSLHFSGAFSSSEKRLPSEVCPFLNFKVRLLYSASPVQCCVVSLHLSLWCAVHTATYTAAFLEDQSPG